MVRSLGCERNHLVTKFELSPILSKENQDIMKNQVYLKIKYILCKNKKM